MISKTIRTVLVGSIGVCSLTFAGCLGPTYGTGKTQGQAFFDDLNGIVALGDTSENPNIDYKPRPDLVTPGNTTILPKPQEKRVADNLPESPEARGERIRSAAYRGDGPIPADVATARKEGVSDDYISRRAGSGRNALSHDKAVTTLTPQEMRSRRDLIRQRVRERNQGDANQRRYLSEPPIAYRKPAAGAPVGDVGTPEEVKERRIKGGGESLGAKLKQLLPF